VTDNQNGVLFPTAAVGADDQSGRNRLSWQEHAMRVSAPWRRTVQDFFETGERLEEAFNELDSQDYAKVLVEVGIDSATARKLRLIAKNDVLRSHANALPRDYTTIHILSQIAKVRLEALIEDGVINANLKRSQADNLADAECSDRAQRRRTGARQTQIQTGDIEAEDATTDDEPAEDQSETDANDPEQLAAEADDVIEAVSETLDRKRRNIERVRTGGDQKLCAMLASGLRDHSAAVTRLADELAPPSAPVEPSPNRGKKRRRSTRKTKSKGRRK
jgi:hypothetical protein